MNRSQEGLPNDDESQGKPANRGFAEPTLTWQLQTHDKNVYEEMEVDVLQWEDQDDDTPPFTTHNCKEEGCTYAREELFSIDNMQSTPGPSKSVPTTGSFDGLIRRRRTPRKRTISPFHSLSDETMLRIFSFLTKPMLCKCASVCKDWKRLCYDESLWASVDMSNLHLPSNGVIGNVLERGVKVLRLAKSQVHGSVFSSEKVRVRMSSRLKRSRTDIVQLEYLDASLCKFNNTTLSQLLQKCYKLKKLSLEGCHLTEADVRGISNNKQLETLNLCMCTGVSATAIASLAQSCPRLESLNIAWTDMETEAVHKACTRFPSLKSLNISGYRMDLTDLCLKTLLVASPNLKHLDISDSPLLGPESLKLLVEQSELESLSICRCFGIPPSDISSLAQLSSLRELQIYGFLNNDGLGHLTRLCPNLVINCEMFSTIARPCSGIYNGTIWDIKCCKT